MPTRRDCVRFRNVAIAEKAASCDVLGFDFDGTFSTVTDKSAKLALNEKFRGYSCSLPGTAITRTRTGAEGSTARRNEAATLEVDGNARAASSAEPSKMIVSSFSDLEFDVMLHDVFRALERGDRFSAREHG